ncbi:MAG: hypothetical protein J5736_01405 [Bacilli bacterium]|nr:hypothetical protein [Bacilli bacterium]
MITISFLGLDQFVVGHYSKEHTANLADLFETEADSLNFFAPNSMLFHEGVEQTSWNVLVIVRAPEKFRPLEGKVANYLLKTVVDFAVNVQLEFEYFEPGRHYEHLNPDYPRYMKESNIHSEEEYDGSLYQEGEDPDHDREEHHHHEEEADPRDRADLDINDPEQIYLGNAFSDFEEKLEERARALEGKQDPLDPKKQS